MRSVAAGSRVPGLFVRRVSCLSHVSFTIAPRRSGPSVAGAWRCSGASCVRPVVVGSCLVGLLVRGCECPLSHWCPTRAPPAVMSIAFHLVESGWSLIIVRFGPGPQLPALALLWCLLCAPGRCCHLRPRALRATRVLLVLALITDCASFTSAPRRSGPSVAGAWRCGGASCVRSVVVGNCVVGLLALEW